MLAVVDLLAYLATIYGNRGGVWLTNQTLVGDEKPSANAIDLIISGKIRRLFTIFVRRFTEPETAVKLQFDSFRE